MSSLQISLFGYIQIVHADLPDEIRLPRTVEALLSYLLLGRHRCHSREVLAELFWQEYESDRARNCLNTALWRLRRALEPEGIERGTYLFTSPHGEIGFNNNSTFWLDVAVFEEVIGRLLKRPASALTEAEAQEIERVLQLYKGDLLEGLYDDWTLRERERLRQLFLDGLAHLLQYYKHQGLIEQGLTCGHRILSCDPLRESVYREMMSLYWLNGRPIEAIRLYQICHQLLADELSITPMAETQALYARIIASTEPNSNTIQIPENLTTLEMALRQLQQATQEFQLAQEKLLKAIRYVEQFTLNNR